MVAPLLVPQRNRTLVHVASSWPGGGGGWTQVDAWCQTARFGLCNDVGSASLYSPSGVIFKPGRLVSSLIKSASLSGKYVRVSRADPAGTVVDGEDGAKFTEVWHGIVGGRGVVPDRATGAFVNTYDCPGIMAVLDSVTPKWHFCRAPSGDVAADIGQAPVFNYLGSKKTGNRSADRYDFGGGVSAYVFDRSPDAVFWTAADVVEYYLALFHYFGDGGPVFTLGGQTGALEYSEKWDAAEHTCGEAVARVLSQKQGIGYRCRVVDGQPVITVKSLSRYPITVPPTAFSSGFTLPANDEQVTVDLTPADLIQDFNLAENSAVVADELVVKMAQPWYGITLSLFESFDPDWDGPGHFEDGHNFVAWDSYDPLDTAGTLNTIFGIARVWRRWKLKDDWQAGVVGGFVMPTKRSTAVGTLNGTGGLSGETTAGGVLAPGALFTMTGELPCLDGYDWSTVDPATVDKTRRNAPAMAFMANDAAGASWTTLGEQCDPPQETLEMAVDGDLAAITFGEAAARVLQAAWSEGIDVYVTVGMMGQLNDAVSWRRDTPSRARDQTRSYSKSRPTLMRKILPRGTVVGVTKDGVLMTTIDEVVIHDDTGIANSILAVSQPWYINPDWTVGFSKVGEVDPEYAEPGQMLVEVDHLEGDGSTTAEDVIGVVTSVELNFDDPGTTKVTTKRIPIDVEAVI